MLKNIREAVRACSSKDMERGHKHLMSMAGSSEFFEGLLRIAVPSMHNDPLESEDVMLQAAIQFKNFLRESSQALSSVALVPFVFAAEAAPKKMLLAAFKQNVKNSNGTDQELLNFIAEALDQHDPVTGLMVTRKVASVYRLATGEAPMDALMKKLFPRVEKLVEHALENYSPDTAPALVAAFKIFSHATFGNIGFYLRGKNAANYDLWLKYIEAMLRRAQQGAAPIAAMKALYQQVQKFGNPKFCPTYVTPLRNNLMQNEWVMMIPLGLISSDKTESEMVVPAIKTASSFLGNPETRDMLIENFKQLQFKDDFRLLSLTEEDAQLWSEDPQEFARRECTESDVETPRSAMLAFILLLTRPITVQTDSRHKGQKKEVKVNSDMLESYLGQCLDLLSSKQTELVAHELAFYLLGNLNENIPLLDHRDLSKLVENIETQALEALRDSQPIIVFRAAWLLGRFARFIERKEQVAKDLAQLVLKHQNTLVRGQAAGSLSHYFREGVGSGMDLESLLQALLELIKEVDMENLLEALEMLLFHARAYLEPYTEALLAELVPHFYELSGEKKVFNEAAGTVLDSLKVLVRASKSSPVLFQKIEEGLLSLVGDLLQPSAKAYAEDGLELFSLLLHYTPKITNVYWDALPVLAGMVLQESSKPLSKSKGIIPSWGFELFPQMLYALQNYVARDPEALVSGPDPPISLILTLCANVNQLTFMKQDFELESLVVCKVYISLIENMPFELPLPTEELVERSLTALKIISDTEEEERKNAPPAAAADSKDSEEEGEYDLLIAMNFQVIALLLARDLEGTWKSIGSEERLSFLLGKWYEFMPRFKHHFELRRIIFGLKSVLCADAAMIPESLIGNFPSLFAQAAPLILKDVEHQVRDAKPELRRKALKEEEDEANPQAEEDSSVHDPLRKSEYDTRNWRTMEVSDDEDDDEEEFEESKPSPFYGKGAKNQVKMDLKRIARDMGEQELADDDILEDYTVLYESPLDAVNEVALFKQGIQELDEARQQAYINELNPSLRDELFTAFETSAQVFSNK